MPSKLAKYLKIISVYIAKMLYNIYNNQDVWYI